MVVGSLEPPRACTDLLTFFGAQGSHLVHFVQEHITRELPSTLTSYIPDIHF
jgi:hypothetical protein